MEGLLVFSCCQRVEQRFFGLVKDSYENPFLNFALLFLELAEPFREA